MLESGAFGPWTPPDYKALAAASPAEYAAMREATRAPGGGAGASPAVAALPPPPMVKTQPTIKEEDEDGEEDGPAVKQEDVAVKQEGPPATPVGAKAAGGSEDAQRSAAVAAALASPPPTPAQIAVEKRVADWLEQVLLPAINRQVCFWLGGLGGGGVPAQHRRAAFCKRSHLAGLCHPRRHLAP